MVRVRREGCRVRVGAGVRVRVRPRLSARVQVMVMVRVRVSCLHSHLFCQWLMVAMAQFQHVAVKLYIEAWAT